jgi:hypothetical protein
MKTVNAFFNGKEVVLPANNSLRITDKEMPLPTGITADFLRNRERVGHTSKGYPIITDDKGKHIVLEKSEYRQESEKVHASSGIGTQPKATVSLDIAKEVLGLKGISAECKAFFQDIVNQYEQANKAKVDNAVKALMALGMSEEQARAAINQN